MNVLNLFDGISCGQIALNKTGIKYDKYYSSEIDNHCITVTQYNYPDTIQLGDITKINGYDLPKIDLMMGGSPCQGFSFAGKMLNFEDSRSKLFFEFVRLLEEVKPKYFLLENVKMKKEYQNIISEYLGVLPIEINSSLVSAQHRRRLYWTNIPDITLPKDKNITINDIIEDDVGGIKIEFNEDGIWESVAKNKKRIVLSKDFKPPYTILEQRTDEGRRERKRLRELYGIDTTPRGPEHKMYVPHPQNKCNCITTIKSELDRVVDRQYNYRYLTMVELERLQNIPDNYTICVSENHRRKMIGNSWTVDVIAHILSFIK